VIIVIREPVIRLLPVLNLIIILERWHSERHIDGRCLGWILQYKDPASKGCLHLICRARLLSSITTTVYPALICLHMSTFLCNSDPEDEELRSYFDGVTKGCDVFRILLVGKSGSGKSTLVSEVFDFDLDHANVEHFSVSLA
jgi:hypothetical protein